MNWAKGRATRGRGTSFKGACRYVLQDKQANTSERVGAIWLRNLATDDPDQAWREMMTLCEAARDLKQRAGVKATGQKLSKPVYAFSLNWHEDDQPDPEHMRETAESALRALGMDHLQALVVEHTDTPHRHVHIIVNLVDPTTGKSASLSNDGHKLDRWADRYEVGQGVIRSPDRRSKFEALDQGRKPPKRPHQSTNREEWEATRKLRNQKAKERADSIRTAYAERVSAMRADHSARYAKRRADGDRLWQQFKADQKGIRDRYKPFIDAIYESRRGNKPHPYTEQAARDMQESAEWKELGRRQFAQKRTFNARERHFLGMIGNAVRLHYANLRNGDPSSLLMLALSLKQRRQAFEKMQGREKLQLKQTQAQQRKGRADVLRAACRHETAVRAEEFKVQRKSLLDRQAAEMASQKKEWRELAAERAKVWADFRREFEIGNEGRDDRSQKPPRDQFNDASRGDARKERSGNDEREPKPRQDREVDRSTSSKPAEKQEGGWRARRPAAERKEDGTYKPRSRGGRDPGRTRGRPR